MIIHKPDLCLRIHVTNSGEIDYIFTDQSEVTYRKFEMACECGARLKYIEDLAVCMQCGLVEPITYTFTITYGKLVEGRY